MGQDDSDMVQSGVVLDTTLADLYFKDCQTNDSRMILVPCYWCSDLDYTDNIARTSKYLYQGTTAPKSPSEIRDLVIQCLSLEAQRFTFAAGRMATVHFDFDDRVGRLDAIKTVAALSESQRPIVNFVAGINDLMRKTAGAHLSVVIPHEGLAAHRQIIHPDVLYELLSKRCLATSGLPTPETKILDLDTCPGTVKHKLSLAECWIRATSLPRVFKTQQGMSSVGTFLIRTAKEREALIQYLKNDILRATLDSVDSFNRHLFPSSLLAQEMITKIKDCFSTAFWVRKNGDCIFLGACRQDFSETNAWLGARIRYPEQDVLKLMLWSTVAKAAVYLHKRGYYGPVGADIIVENNEHDTPRQWIIDLNVRMTGSLTLAFLKGHFSVRRGLHEACITQRFKFPLKRDGFRKLFSKELSEGKMIIVAWFTDVPRGCSWANLILGAKDGLELEMLHGKFKAIAI